jgi:methyltransferase (TIGR00027 family)
MSGAEPSGVSRTAVLVAGLRAREGERADPWFDDQFAGAFLTAAGGGAARAAAALPPGTSEYMAIRTRFIDDHVRMVSAAGIRQVVLLAAGLDCRAFRLDWPEDMRLFELDLPDLFAFKEPVLASVEAVAQCRRDVVAVDLSGQWADALTAAGFDPGVAALWLAEGLLPYLDQAQSEHLLATATELSAPGSHMVFDYVEPLVLEQLKTTHTLPEDLRQVAALLKPAEGSPVDWLGTHGWQYNFFRMPALGEQYGRPWPADTDVVGMNATMLITASR